jgi:hypothetical protein
LKNQENKIEQLNGKKNTNSSKNNIGGLMNKQEVKNYLKKSNDKKLITIENNHDGDAEIYMTSQDKNKDTPNSLKKYNSISDVSILKNHIQSLFENSNNILSKYENKINSKLEILNKKIEKNMTLVSKLKKSNLEDGNFSNNYDNSLPLIKNINSSYLNREANNKANSVNFYKNVNISDSWKNSIILLEKKNYNGAFEEILKTKDDIYLLRLLCLTGPIFNELLFDVSKNVLLRINMISRSQKIQNLLYELIKSSLENSIFQKMSKQDQNEILETLYDFSGIKSELGKKSAYLYTKACKTNTF